MVPARSVLIVDRLIRWIVCTSMAQAYNIGVSGSHRNDTEDSILYPTPEYESTNCVLQAYRIGGNHDDVDTQHCQLGEYIV